jgi:hypothetical protein
MSFGYTWGTGGCESLTGNDFGHVEVVLTGYSLFEKMYNVEDGKRPLRRTCATKAQLYTPLPLSACPGKSSAFVMETSTSP